MVLYVETSAALTWLLGQKRADRVRTSIDAADAVVTSSLTIAESGRALVRARQEGLLRAADHQRLRGLLQRARAGWMTMAVSDGILVRAAESFPVEPLRTLDTIHLATALELTRAFPEMKILSYDRRILENVEALGLDAIG